jgi:hypothetical protein
MPLDAILHVSSDPSKSDDTWCATCTNHSVTHYRINQAALSNVGVACLYRKDDHKDLQD